MLVISDTRPCDDKPEHEMTLLVLLEIGLVHKGRSEEAYPHGTMTGVEVIC